LQNNPLILQDEPLIERDKRIILLDKLLKTVFGAIGLYAGF
jgi:hypothetical protein